MHLLILNGYERHSPSRSALPTSHFRTRIPTTEAQRKHLIPRPTICEHKKYIFMDTAGLLSHEIRKFALLTSISLNLWNQERAL
jgi:hypothetical protein